MSNNNVKDWGEFQKLAELHQLEDLLFVGMLSIFFIKRRFAVCRYAIIFFFIKIVAQLLFNIHSHANGADNSSF